MFGAVALVIGVGHAFLEIGQSGNLTEKEGAVFDDWIRFACLETESPAAATRSRVSGGKNSLKSPPNLT